ncbi:MAG: hypothetical protein C4345_06295, partial [Chloroflexota bacterium]
AFDVESREYSFMTIGPVSPLSFSGSPLFFNAFNNVEAFLAANRLNLRQPTRVPPSRVAPSQPVAVGRAASSGEPQR